MSFTRRTFSSTLASTLAASFVGASAWFSGANRPALASKQLLANVDPDHYFVFCHFPGAWDVQLSLDPKDPAIFTNDKIQQTRIQPGYELLPAGHTTVLDSSVAGMRFGPYIGKLIEHAPRLAIVRGLSMDTLSHPVGVRYFNTGRPPAGLAARGSSLAAVAAGLLGKDQAIPNLSAAVETYNVDQPAYASGVQVSRVDDLVDALKPGGTSLSLADRVALENFLQEQAQCPDQAQTQGRALAHAQHLASQKLMGQDLASRFDFAAKTPEMDELRARYGFGATDLASPQARMAMASVALRAGICRSVSLAACPGLDTHGAEWASEQGPNQQIGFDGLATLITDLADQEYHQSGSSWLDHTTILAYSDFGRTALLNPREGRDHSLCSSCLLVGGKIRGGTLIGASSDLGMAPQAIDLATGTLRKDGTIIRPSHILRAMLLAAGISDDVANLRDDPLQALLV